MQTPVTLDVTAATGQSIRARVSFSHRNYLLKYRMQAALARKWPSSLRPLRRLALSIKYIFVNITAPWTTISISLFEQTLCEGGIDVRNNTNQSLPAMVPLYYLRQPILNFLPLTGANVVFTFGGMV